MKTSKNYFSIITLIITILLSVQTLQSQDLIAFAETTNWKNSTSEVKLEHSESAMQLLVLIDDSEFNYRKNLRKSRKSRTSYFSKGTTFSETQVLKILKKASRKDDGFKAFNKYLKKVNFQLLNSLSVSERMKTYERFRVTTFQGYIDRLEQSDIIFL